MIPRTKAARAAIPPTTPPAMAPVGERSDVAAELDVAAEVDGVFEVVPIGSNDISIGLFPWDRHRSPIASI